MFRKKNGLVEVVSLLGLAILPLAAEQSIPAVEVGNPNWGILVTPEGYSDVAIDKRPGFIGREYLSGEWAAAIFYLGGSNPSQPIWLRKVWVFPCWESNSNFTVIDPVGLDSPVMNGDGLFRYISRVTNGDVEIMIQYEMVDTTTGVMQGDERESAGGPGRSTLSDPYVLMQTYTVKNVSGGDLSGVKFYHFLHGLKTGLSLYDDRDYGGPLGSYRYDNAQKGTSRGFHSGTGEIYSHDDSVCMHAMDLPSAFECGYYGVEPVDDHQIGKPSIGTHLSVEANSLSGLDYFVPEAPATRWVSGAMCFDFPDLADQASHEFKVLLSVRTVSTLIGPEPRIRTIEVQREGAELVLDFEETTGAPLDGFILRSSKDLNAEFPADWPQVPIPYTIGLPFPGANRFRIPIDPVANRKCFFRIQPFLE